MSMGRIILIGIVLFAVICVGCIALGGLGLFGLFQATQPVVDATDDFMEALKGGDYATAYGMMTPSLQAEVGSAESLQTGLAIIPESWSITTRNISSNNDVTTGDTGGTLTAKDGTKHNFTVTLEKDGDDWFISGFNFDA